MRKLVLYLELNDENHLTIMMKNPDGMLNVHEVENCHLGRVALRMINAAGKVNSVQAAGRLQ